MNGYGLLLALAFVYLGSQAWQAHIAAQTRKQELDASIQQSQQETERLRLLLRQQPLAYRDTK